MSEIQAMRAIAKNPEVAPYISPKRLERVAKCCDLYRARGLSDVRQTGNILKRVYLTETGFGERFIAKHPGQFKRFVVNEPDIITTAKQTDMKALKTLITFNEYLRKAKKVIAASIINNGWLN